MTRVERLDRRAALVGSALVAGALMVVLDTTIINVAIGHLSQAMGTPLPVTQWVVTGYTLALATVMPITAWAIGRIGGKRVYLLALTVFLAGSLAAGLAWNMGSLVAFRAVQGLGGGLIVPVAMTLALRAAPPAQRGRIMGIMGIPVLIGPAIGPTLGGWILDALSWRWIFFVNLPIGILAIVLGAAILRTEPADRTHRLDLVGLVLLSPGLAALLYGLAALGRTGPAATVPALTLTLAGAVLIAAFAVRAATVAHPLLDLRLLRLRPMAVGAGVLALFAAAYFGSMFLAPLYYQVVRGESAFASGLLMLPQALATGITMQVASRLIDRVAAVKVIGVGIGLAVAGCVTFALSVSSTTGYWVLSTALAVAGVGIGATLMPTMTTATRWLSHDQVPSGTTLLNVTQQAAVSFGTAVTSVLLSSSLISRLPQVVHNGVGDIYQLSTPAVRAIAPQLATTFSTTFLLPITGMTTALVVALVWLPRARRHPRSSSSDGTTQHRGRSRIASADLADALPDDRLSRAVRQSSSNGPA